MNIIYYKLELIELFWETIYFILCFEIPKNGKNSILKFLQTMFTQSSINFSCSALAQITNTFIERCSASWP